MDFLPEIQESVPRSLLAATRHEDLYAIPQGVAGTFGWAVAQEEPSVVDVDVVASRGELEREQMVNGYGARDDPRSLQQDRASAGLAHEALGGVVEPVGGPAKLLGKLGRELPDDRCSWSADDDIDVFRGLASFETQDHGRATDDDQIDLDALVTASSPSRRRPMSSSCFDRVAMTPR